MENTQIPRRRSYKPRKPGFTIKIFTIVSIIIAIICAHKDKGPPLPPFGDKFTSFDCHSISFKSFNDRSGQIDFKFSTLPSIEYPPEYLPHFLSITIHTGPVTMKYSGDEIENISRSETEIEFSIEHTFAGDSTITAQCLKNPPQTLKGHLSDIVIHKPQYSTSDDPGIDQAKFHDVCLEYEKFLYFVTVSGDRPSVPFDDTRLRFEMLKWPLDAYLNHKKVSVQKKTCFLVAPIDKKPWKTILLTLIPLSISVSKNTKNSNEALFIFRKNIPDNAASVLKFLSSNPPVKLDDIMCFPTLLMTSTYSKIDDNKNRINEMLSQDLEPLRQKMKRSQTIPKKIVVAENLFQYLKDPITKAIPDAQVVMLSTEENVNSAANIVSSANIFIGGHITSLIHIIWMNQQQSTVIDVTNKDCACNKWARNLSNKIGVNYVSINEADKCECDNFNCYMTKSSDPVDLNVDKVIAEIQKAL
ncbi:hypothetical protein M9Y10_044344 [Tritrichomonas musculus]|uniref:Uncharacterized protein n=1 Tax=Tritrichomonas musculus TaxID=1915356 RepID=A0ABR2GK75_9EUKA